jgi:NADP-dependent alcohol dehydrogenase
VWGVCEGTKEECIDRTIEATEQFFRSLGLATRLSELNIGEDVVEEIVRRFGERGTLLGENNNIDYRLVEQILRQRM